MTPLENMMFDSGSAALQHIYDIYGDWVSPRFSFACRKGCSSCCTRSVTMTSLEGKKIMAFLDAREDLSPAAKDCITELFTVGSSNPPVMTTNRFAEYCLNQEEPPQENQAPWDMTPCAFLDNDCCSIYPVRPFGCRSFGSQEECRLSGEAVVPSLMIAANTACLQLIEHLDCQSGRQGQGGRWGYLSDILRNLAGIDDRNLLPTRPLPGFLLAPQEEKEIRALLTRMYRALGNAGLKETAGHDCRSHEKL